MNTNNTGDKPYINVIGAGLAGCEAAWQASRAGVAVRLYEMKPQKRSDAHRSDMFCELVCSNSFRAAQLSNAVGLLKREMHMLGSLIMECAYECEVPAGGALAVDRELFSRAVTEKIKNDPNITVICKELTELPSDAITVVATGPLTSDPLAYHLKNTLGMSTLSFFDAAAPIVSAESIDMDKAYVASRYGKGEACYVNCPMNRERYDEFYNALVNAKRAKLKDFDEKSQEDLSVFEGCMPVEVMAERGYETLLYGPMKPVGLTNPKTGKEDFAVVQLRLENKEGSMYNMVGFQTHLTFEEQRKVFSLIPGLENAEFLRYGVMHRNTFLRSPELLDSCYRLRSNEKIYFAGQMTGVEGYLESASSGFVAGTNAARAALGAEPIDFVPSTAIGALAHYVSEYSGENFQPMNINFGIMDTTGIKLKGKRAQKREAIAEHALSVIEEIRKKYYSTESDGTHNV